MHADLTNRHAPKRSAWEIQRAVFLALFVRELKTRFGGRWLGVFWVLLEPTAHLAMLLVIFAFIRHRLLPGLEFPVFLLTGLVPFFVFRNLTLRGMDSVDSNRGLFGYRQVKPIDPMLARALLEVSLYSLIFVTMLAVMGWLGIEVAPHRPLEWLGVFAIVVVLGFSLGLVFAICTDDLPELRSFVRILFVPLYLLSGVMFPVATLSESVLPWLLWNPMLHAIEVSRGFFFTSYHVIPQVSLLYPIGCALLALTLGLMLYRVRRHRLLAT